MPKISDTSVLDAVMALTGETERGKTKVISPSALAKLTGKTTASVKEILATNEAALLRDKDGRLIGTKVLNAAQTRGLLVLSTLAAKGTGCFQTFREGAKVIGRFNMDRTEDVTASTDFENRLLADGKIICSNFSEIPIDVLVSVWQEDGLFPETTPILKI